MSGCFAVGVRDLGAGRSKGVVDGESSAGAAETGGGGGVLKIAHGSVGSGVEFDRVGGRVV